MKTTASKTQRTIFSLALLLFSFIAAPVWADLIDEGKSDSAIKMLVFPKSLRVIENRGSEEKSDLFSDPKIIRKTLLKLDPARIVPAKTGKPFIGPVTRESLRQLAKKYSEDLIFLFRRKLNNEKNTVRLQGLLYLAKQKKVLALKESVESGSENLQEMVAAGLKALAKEAKRVLHSHKFEKRQSAY